MTYTYRHTLHACYTGYITQAIVNNLAPLLFVIFQSQYGLSYEMVGRLILINFGVQLIADLLSVRYADRIGYRRAAGLAHLLCMAGLLLLAALPNLLPDPYPGLVAAVTVYALGGGLLEVLVSPIVNSLPGEEKESAMSLLHSFYCWGQVGVVLLSTLLLRLTGPRLWPLLPVLWCLVPLLNFFRFRKVPLAPPIPEAKLMSVRELFRSRFFVVALVLMLCAGASELTMSQWSSLFAQKALQLPKVLGDLLGPCLFAVFMGAGRTLYGVFGSRLRLRPALFFCGGLCLACYAGTVFFPWPVPALMSCALCGFAVSLMWPGTFSLSAARFPAGGTALFGMLAVFGDLGGSLGPWLTGVLSDRAEAAYGKFLPLLPQIAALSPSRFGLKCGLLAAAVFPLLLLLGLFFFRGAQNGRDSG